jgi:hypothetical protein
MALPSSGPLSIDDIRTELGSSSGSLRTLSAAAGKSTPDAISEFYSYSSFTPSDNFKVISYSGSWDHYNQVGGAQNISTGFRPDLVWIKKLGTLNHAWWDALLGADVLRFPGSGGNIIYGTSNNLTSFNSNSYTLGTGTTSAQWNESGVNYISYCWKGSNSTVSNTSGTVTSSVRANQAGGFSIVKWTGTAQSFTKVGHGLGAVPQLIIVMNSTSGFTDVYTSAVGSAGYLNLNDDDGWSSVIGGRWNNTAPTSSVFTVDSTSSVNGSGNTMMAYCFANVSGYQNIGGYSGNSGTRAVNTGFQPKFLVIKCHTTGTGNESWKLFDSNRGTSVSFEIDGASTSLSTSGVSFTSTGFSITSSSYELNRSGQSYFYWAIA